MAKVDELLLLGAFWAGATGPAIPIVFARTNGGYLNCTEPTSGRNAVCTGFLRRWDAQHQSAQGQILIRCVLAEVDPPNGRYLWDWLACDGLFSSVPPDPGIYVLQVQLLMPSGQEFPSQRALIEVLPSTPAVY